MSGTFAASAPAHGIESSFCKAAMARSGSPMLRRHPGEDLDRTGTVQRVFLDRDSAAIARSAKVNAAALSPRPILVSARSPIRPIIFRLFFEERFQFAARLSPTFLGGGMVAGDFLRPA